MKTLDEKCIGVYTWHLPDVPMTFVMLILVCAAFLDLPHTAALLLCAVVHELGHLLALCILGGRGIVIGPGVFGLEIGYDPLSLSPTCQCVAALGGPAAGIVIALLLGCVQSAMWRYTGHLSMALSIFNLLPLSLLDGGVVCAGMLQSVLDAVAADRICFVLDMAVLILFVSAAVYTALYFSQFYLLVVSVCLVIAYCGKR